MSDVIKINPIDPTLIVNQPLDHVTGTITFETPQKTLLELSNDGFRFGDELITDAGEAHRAFLEVMRLMKKELDPTKEKSDADL
tara:strand:+ start:355 stop:606 length:252 start_codon:yes stop_codon:yes gene_type:complete